ncbi:MAG: nodulation protein NfeD [Candidatus Desulforudis sp.]|nr:nodulation protein NfeD [Desulforudis sp.]MBV1736076.1 nodulation protein NfeD [Desulforudis sp.]MBV1769691.1 nodulation protein NfeD [Desulforudis sp.]
MLAFCLAFLPVPLAQSGAPASELGNENIVVLRVDGPIVPVVARYLERGLEYAQEQKAHAVIIELNTPGGLLETTNDMVRQIMNQPMPVVVYVSPAGGWAGSAGTFITIAADVAAMAPGSRIGAAHPVGGQGEEIQGPMADKITEDTAAWIRSIAETRGRDAEKAELAVIESRSYTDNQAKEFNLIDIQARDMDDLLKQLDGWQVTLISGVEQEIGTEGRALDRQEMTSGERFLYALSNPNIAYLLLSIGMLGLLLEFYNPGSIFPGAAGGLALLVALYSLGTLEASWSGILLIMLGFVLFGLELFVASFGFLTAGGVISIILGSFMLFAGNSPAFAVNWGVVAGVVVSLVAFVVIAVQAVVKAQKQRTTTGAEAFIGDTGWVVTPLDPTGEISFQGERWTAIAEDSPIESGVEVEVLRQKGLRLYVKRAEDGNRG